VRHRLIETEKLVSLHHDFAPIGQVRFTTPDEARLLVSIGRARYADEAPDVASADDGYRHREMTATTRPQFVHHKKHHRR
jgi:hypothetical protein